MSEKQFRPTEAELEILHILWEHGPASVRAVNERLNERREVGYTTTLKMMQIMLEKGMVERNTDSRSHIYVAVVRESDTQKQLLNRFLQSTFRGSASQLVMQLLGNHKATDEELAQIKELIRKIETENQ
ncbi:MAG: BlaI/MecI/CopY family transcriptional regulator [Saprospiraceae bacterium]|nr:BlaI/MecI/CopY family transcriptional regulator [Saprospiraceae bacterium]